MDPSVLIVYNTCGAHGRDLSEAYAAHLRALLRQWRANYWFVWSDCCTGEGLRGKIREQFGGFLSYSFVDELIPLPITFNAAILRMVEAFGEFDHYLYVECGVNMMEFPDYVQGMVAAQTAHPEYGILMGLVDNDSSLPEYAPDFPQGARVAPVPYGKAINLHVALFSRDFANAWDHKLLPDVFFNNGSEAAMPFLCAAIHKKFGAYLEPRLAHRGELDLPNHAYPSYPPHIPKAGEGSFLATYEEGAKYGLGWDTLVGFTRCVSDRTLFDAEGYARCPELYGFLKQKLFLSASKVDYTNISGRFIA